jgi:phosphoribosyl 1,2-cyclic phosphate phosphodiesterase
MLEVDGKVILFDAGPDFRQQMLRENVQRLDAILLTHEHKDHTAGIDDVRAFNYVMRKSVDIFCEKRVEHSVVNEFSYAFADDKYPGTPEITLKTIDDKKDFVVAGLTVCPIRIVHFKLPILGYRIGRFAYLTDANHIPEESWEKLTGVEILALNALRKEKHLSHFALNEALDVINRIEPQAAYLTHISHQMGFHKEIQKELPQNVFLAYDGLKVNLSGII